MNDVKSPPQPLPTRGRDYDAALSHANLIVAIPRTVTACEIFAFGRRREPQLSPSPLWGGVGEGFSPTRSKGAFSRLHTERPA